MRPRDPIRIAERFSRGILTEYLKLDIMKKEFKGNPEVVYD